MNDATKTIMLCVAGLTPQIVTETLYALLHRTPPETVDEIRVITTLKGRDKIMRDLLDTQTGKFYEFCRDFNLDSSSIKFDETSIALLRTPDGRTLDDIRAVADNEAAANQICDIVRELTQDSRTQIHASAAGGRKTMGIYLTAAMQLFGRAQDRLSHVLISEEFEMHPQFFYKPPQSQVLNNKDGTLMSVSTDDAQIELADIPFIRLRGLMLDHTRRGERNYNQLVREVQEDLLLLESDFDLRFDFARRRIKVASRMVTLREREFLFYVLFACARKASDSGDGFLSVEEICREHFAAAFSLIAQARDFEGAIDDADLLPRMDFLSTYTAQAASEKSKDKEDLKCALGQIISKANRCIERAGLPPRYAIATQGKRGAQRYGLLVAPERIVLG